MNNKPNKLTNLAFNEMEDSCQDPPLQFRILPLVQPSATNQPIDKQLIKKLCEIGLSECPDEDRCIAWLVLLNIYSEYAIEWPQKRDELIDIYFSFVNNLNLNDWHNKRFKGIVRQEDMKPVNNPALMHIIYNDMNRSGNQFYFFPPIEPSDTTDDPDDKFSFFVSHVRRIERILYVFGSYNPSLYYMQGYNEIISPLYFVMVSSRQLFDNNLDHVEAITFHCFQHLMNGTAIQEFYLTDDNSSIIHNRLNIYQKILEKHLPHVAEILNGLDIQPLQYVYKWINILFAREHPMPTTLIIWDSLFAHIEDLITFVYYVAVSRLFEVADKLNENDLADTVSKLQNIEIQNIYKVLRRANDLYTRDKYPSPLDIIKERFRLFKKS